MGSVENPTVGLTEEAAQVSRGLLRGAVRARGRRTWPRHLRAVRSVEGMICAEEADLLFQTAAAVTQGVIVEVGSFRGRSTVALALGARAGIQPTVYAIDPHEPFRGVLGGEFGPEDRAAFFRAMLDTGCYREVRLVNLSSAVVTPGWSLPVALLWIDGDHTYEGVRADLDGWAPHLTDDATVLFDDATDPQLGPYRLIAERIATGEFVEVGGAGKIRGLRWSAPRSAV